MNNEMVHYTNYSPIIIVDSPLTSSLCLIIAHRVFFLLLRLSRRGILPMNIIHMYQCVCAWTEIEWNWISIISYFSFFGFIIKPDDRTNIEIKVRTVQSMNLDDDSLACSDNLDRGFFVFFYICIHTE